MIRSISVIGFSLSLVGAAPVTAGPWSAQNIDAASARVQTVQFLPGSGFPNPRIHGVPVDWCSTWSTNCGPGGATLFCGMHGFSRAIGWDVIQTPTTYVIGSNRYCNADYCKGYSFIRCG
jgi:hypothetical protein